MILLGILCDIILENNHIKPNLLAKFCVVCISTVNSEPQYHLVILKDQLPVKGTTRCFNVQKQDLYYSLMAV